MINYRVPVISDVLDQCVLSTLMIYYWPFFIAGNIDSWAELRSNLCKPYK
jgi:hypothetical protein